MLADLASAIATVALLCCSTVARPKHARCARTWYVNGVRPSGVFECRPAAGGDPRFDGVFGTPDRARDRPGWLRSRIHCTNGTHAIVVLGDRENRTVGCQR